MERASSPAKTGKNDEARLLLVKFLLRRCIICGRYTLEADKCPICGGDLAVPHPAKFSPEDRYARLRRRPREE